MKIVKNNVISKSNISVNIEYQIFPSRLIVYILL